MARAKVLTQTEEDSGQLVMWDEEKSLSDGDAIITEEGWVSLEDWT